MTIFSCPLDARLMIINANPNITYSPNKDTDAREEGHWRYALISGRGEVSTVKDLRRADVTSTPLPPGKHPRSENARPVNTVQGPKRPGVPDFKGAVAPIHKMLKEFRPVMPQMREWRLERRKCSERQYELSNKIVSNPVITRVRRREDREWDCFWIIFAAENCHVCFSHLNALFGEEYHGCVSPRIALYRVDLLHEVFLSTFMVKEEVDREVTSHVASHLLGIHLSVFEQSAENFGRRGKGLVMHQKLCRRAACECNDLSSDDN